MTDLEFRLLGPLEVWRGAQQVRIDAPRQRAVLATLLLNANRVVPVDRLIELVWDRDPPASARNTVQSLVLRLRRALEPSCPASPGAGATGAPGAAGATGATGAPDAAGATGAAEATDASEVEARVLLTRRPGYLLRVAPDQVDVHRFERLLVRGRAALAAGSPDEAAGLLRGALALWRGSALLDTAAVGLCEQEAPRLADLRLAALEERLDCDLVLGRHRELVGELRGLVAEHPLRERLYGQLMLALYRSGRQAEALAVYAKLRGLLVGELGVEPEPAVQRLHHDMLRRNPALDLDGGEVTVQAVPCQLPPDVGDFTGRQHDVATLSTLLTAAGAPGVVVSGQAGVGKTALAIHLGHRVREHYPHGRLFVDLRGMDPCPRDPFRVLGQFLRALGVAANAVPEDAGERVTLYRTLMAERRVLVVLDNAVDEAQVRPLLPGAAGCGVLVTSRRTLATLEGLHVVRLGLLPPDEAVALLRRIVGSSRTAGPSDDADRVATLCGRLPLALRIAGARLVTRPHWSLTHFAERLATVRSRLDELVAGDLEVRASLALSVPGLSPAQWQALCRLGALWCDDFAPWLAAAVLDVPLDRAADLVDQLVDAQLVEATGTDPARQFRYGFHDLVRLFVREQPEPAGDRNEAVRRALGACVEFAQHAAAGIEHVAPHGTAAWSRPDPDGGGWQCAQVEAALAGCDPFAWFDAERRTLVSAVGQAAAAGLAGYAWRLAHALAVHFEVRGHWEDWRHTHEQALAAARAANDPDGEAALLTGLGQLAVDQGLGPVAVARLTPAVALAREVDEPVLRASALRKLGEAYVLAGKPGEAIAHYESSLTLAREHRYRAGEAQSLRGLGLAYRDAGRITEALGMLESVLRIVREVGDHRMEPWALGTLGMLHVEARQWEPAAASLREAATVAAGLGDIRARVYALRGLADALRCAGQAAEAAEILREVLQIVRELGEDLGEAQTLRRLGEAYADLGHRDEAVRCLRGAREVAAAVGFDRLDAEAAYALSLVLLDGGDLDDAVACLEFCAGVFDRHGMRLPRARACLALSGALRRLGRTDRAAVLYDEAARLFGEADLPVPADHIGA